MARPRPPVAEREAIDFLARRLAARLVRLRRTALAAAVRSAVGAGSVRVLGDLPEAQRRELLWLLEADAASDGLSPRASVLLAGTLAGLPSPEEGWGRRFALPAR